MRAGLRVGGIEVEVRASRGPLEAILVERYAPFLGAVERPVCQIVLEPGGSKHREPRAPVAPVRGGTGRHISIEHPGFRAELDLLGHGTVQIVPDPAVVDECFRIVTALLATRCDALLLDAGGVIIHGRAHVFVGAREADTSTLAGLAGTRALLGDRCVIVRRQRGGWIAASTPFWAAPTASGAREAPLSTLWRVREASSDEVLSGDPIEAARRVLEHAVLPGPDATFREAAAAVAADLAQDVSSAELRFTPSSDVWELIDDCVVA